MKLWMDVMRDLESVMNDHERILDAWAEGGVDGVVFGPLVFGTDKLSQKATTASNGAGPSCPKATTRLGISRTASLNIRPSRSVGIRGTRTRSDATRRLSTT